MKQLASFLLLLTLLIFACTSPSKEEAQTFTPGTYIRAAQQEFGTEHDTLVIRLQNEGANEYSINRRWLYERVLDGKPVEPEYKNTTTSAVYDATAKRLKEPKSGASYTFDEKQKVLFAGTTKYEKLK